MGRWKYCTVRLGAPAKFRILHSKISHKTNKQWVKYNTALCSRSDRVISGRDIESRLRGDELGIGRGRDVCV